jgi:hypothetical protein
VRPAGEKDALAASDAQPAEHSQTAGRAQDGPDRLAGQGAGTAGRSAATGPYASSRQRSVPHPRRAADAQSAEPAARRAAQPDPHDAGRDAGQTQSSAGTAADLDQDEDASDRAAAAASQAREAREAIMRVASAYLPDLAQASEGVQGGDEQTDARQPAGLASQPVQQPVPGASGQEPGADAPGKRIRQPVSARVNRITRGRSMPKLPRPKRSAAAPQPDQPQADQVEQQQGEEPAAATPLPPLPPLPSSRDRGADRRSLAAMAAEAVRWTVVSEQADRDDQGEDGAG